MMFIGPLAIIGIQIAASLVAKKLAGGQSGGSKQIEGSIAAKNTAEARLLGMKQGFLRDLSGFRDDVRRQILDPKTGKPLVIRLPGVGGVSGDEFSRILSAMVEQTDFGGMREASLLKDMIGLASPGSNSSGAGANIVAQEAATRQANQSGMANFLSDAGQALVGQMGGGQAAPIGNVDPTLTGISPIESIATPFLDEPSFAPNPFDQGGG